MSRVRLLAVMFGCLVGVHPVQANQPDFRLQVVPAIVYKVDDPGGRRARTTRAAVSNAKARGVLPRRLADWQRVAGEPQHYHMHPYRTIEDTLQALRDARHDAQWKHWESARNHMARLIDETSAEPLRSILSTWQGRGPCTAIGAAVSGRGLLHRNH